ncbi:PREDICTED: ephrin-A4 [Tinamus guttatus]|uniref:ephrin-A4 n=1 Tax=Tinamus guttatus TaxID=94827 RepID=UPI00052F2395|nr:PREDICTED: ephrin-A4 [Tinamus guttatus]
MPGALSHVCDGFAQPWPLSALPTRSDHERVGPAAPSSPPPGRFLRDDYAVQVSINDHLDIYCPHYEGAAPGGRAETFTLFMVDREGYRGCYATPSAFKRWECNRPHAPFGPVRFSEKIQRFSPFPLGFEFQPGETYYYICECLVPEGPWATGAAGAAGARPGMPESWRNRESGHAGAWMH